MTLEISSKRRNEIKQQVYNTLVIYGTPILPLKIGGLIRNIKNVKLITYSSQIRKFGITYKELILNAETKDSYAVYNRTIDKYCIYYNDMDNSIISSHRIRWNLAHELGHVILEHHKLANVEKLYREGFDDNTYRYLEDEANYFAQLILVPHIVLLGLKLRKPSDIKYRCQISNQALNRRVKEYEIWCQHSHVGDSYDELLFRYYYNFIFKKTCKNCEAGLVQRYGKHCPICGSKNTLEWGEGDKMKYPLLPTYESKKLKECPKCKNEETEINGTYCQICGGSLVNTCLNQNCSNIDVLPSNARYCPICGEKSSFYKDGIIKVWNYSPNSFGFLPDGIDEELPFN